MQLTARKWSFRGFKNRLVQIQILSLYIEIHDLMLFLAITSGQYDTQCKQLKKTFEPNNAVELQTKKMRLICAGDNCFSRTRQLFNFSKKIPLRYGPEKNKRKNMLDIFYEHVHKTQ